MYRFRLCALAAVSLLAACSQPAPPQATRPPKPNYDIVAQIRAAGEREKSAIDVAPLRDPGVQGLAQSAQSDERAGHFPEAASKLDSALKMAPDAPEIIQDRAEVAVRMNDFPLAEKLARQSYQLGPKLGSLCARNWQTVIEMRMQADDNAGAATARQELTKCHVAGPNRF
ncbi:tetratricopeptide (TPR) repeat protein [Luteibacter sp. Sphag1AF]|uniref:tetratricopeptide repeat protein n=1 Tax=Luteibacter sp. Sphag1AF TaxID=2587031 RepID=UPI001620F8CA|nr:tetratricopeptide repeat protein [Luteibacter sp. Sphag1AF]MBB3225490.1 tetratricopeptide (TPR) repeat protein [Luteibacter sp. Sphag1AF]